MRKNYLESIRNNCPKIWEQFSEWLFTNYRTNECFDYGKMEYDSIVRQFEKFGLVFQLGIFLEFADAKWLYVSYDRSQFPANEHTKGFWCYCYKIVNKRTDHHLTMGYHNDTPEQAYQGSILAIFNILGRGIKEVEKEVDEQSKRREEITQMKMRSLKKAVLKGTKNKIEEKEEEVSLYKTFGNIEWYKVEETIYEGFNKKLECYEYVLTKDKSGLWILRGQGKDQTGKNKDELMKHASK